MDDLDLDFRNRTYGLVRELARPPRLDEAARHLGVEREEVAAAWRRLHDAHALVLGDDGEIRMAMPFSGVPTPYRVEADGRSWYANCAWDAFGICAALGSDGHVSSSCPDCADAIEIGVRAGRPERDEHVVHLLVPARSWWDDIVFT